MLNTDASDTEGCSAAWSIQPSWLKRRTGAWVFRGTRIPLAALFQNLEDGVSLAEFVELFPGVSLEQAQELAEHAGIR